MERASGLAAQAGRRAAKKKLLIVNALLAIHLFMCQHKHLEALPVSLPPTGVGSHTANKQHPLPDTAQTTANRTTTSQPDQTLVNNSNNNNNSSNISKDTKALNYLQKYGYMSRNLNAAANNLISEDSFASAISSFQRFAGLPDTGFADEQTLKYMELPRCGNRDLLRIKEELPAALNGTAPLQRNRRRRKRYALQGSKWRRQELTYRISQYPTRFIGRREEVDGQIERALALWSQAAPIDFVVKREGRVHIDIRFASGDHGDGDAFDGPGNTLAHAYFPQYGGDAHFDDQEFWTVDSHAGTNIFQVAAHELGHSLGLGHSSVREALMAPFYQKYKPDFKLHGDDVLAIQALYGEKPLAQSETMSSLSFGAAPPSLLHHRHHHHQHHHHHHLSSTPALSSSTSSSTSTTTTTTAQPSTTAKQPPTTAIHQHPQWATPANRSAAPEERHQFWPIGSIVPGEAVASTTRPSLALEPSTGAPQADSREINDNDMEPATEEDGPPRGGITPPPPTMESGSAGSGADLCSDPRIDAATGTQDGNYYVFKGHNYWQLGQEGLLSGYPRSISADWDQLPGHLDAALTWADGKTFFFKGNKYWRFRNRRREVGYPKLISQGFAGIPDNLDAALVWGGNGRTYFFKGAEYWRFDSKADPPVSSDYPRSMKLWHGVPAHVDAALRWQNNVTYFFKGPRYYRFNDREFKVEQKGRPHFPRSTGEWWFGCGPSNHLAQRSSPSNLQEGSTTSHQHREDIDWSFFAGLQPETRIQGTHISDQKPHEPHQSTPPSTNRQLFTFPNFLRPVAASNSSPASTLHLCDSYFLFRPIYLAVASLLISKILSTKTIYLAKH